jgi:hypothetical protein
MRLSMKFLYTGEIPDGVSITQEGVEFRAGTASEVSDPAAIERLKGNRFFEPAQAIEEAPADGNDANPDGPGDGGAAGPRRNRRGRPGGA